MVRMGSERVLIIGDSQRQVRAALAQALPTAQIVEVPDYFDGIGEASSGSFTAVLAAAEPIERRPEPAVRTLRSLAGDARLVLFGHPTLEPLSRKMLEFGCDDYIITPTTPGELHQIFGSARLRIAPAAPAAPSNEENDGAESPEQSLLGGLPLADIFLSAMTTHPHDAVAQAIRELNKHLGPTIQLVYLLLKSPAPTAGDGRALLSQIVPSEGDQSAHLHLMLPRDEDADSARHMLSHLAELVGKLQSLQDRHARLQKLAITDELTGLYNSRYFRHFLTRIIERAREKLFPVTLLIFDIDNFKQYNDEYGHGVGDEILRQTANLMRRTCREHDLVARLGGDEFAVVFWEKEGPRQLKDPQSAGPSRPPQGPEAIYERFRKLLATQEFQGLGTGGKGMLTISAGLAVFPYHAGSVDELIELADKRLMFGAKRGGKNSLVLVGNPQRPESTKPGKREDMKT